MLYNTYTNVCSLFLQNRITNFHSNISLKSYLSEIYRKISKSSILGFAHMNCSNCGRLPIKRVLLVIFQIFIFFSCFERPVNYMNNKLSLDWWEFFSIPILQTRRLLSQKFKYESNWRTQSSFSTLLEVSRRAICCSVSRGGGRGTRDSRVKTSAIAGGSSERSRESIQAAMFKCIFPLYNDWKSRLRPCYVLNAFFMPCNIIKYQEYF